VSPAAAAGHGCSSINVVCRGEEAEVDDAENAPHGVRSYAIDPEVAQQLWVASEGMVGEGLDLL